jgi:hypothetical protein
MFAEKATTAKLASQKFTSLMTEKPTSWGENLIEVCADIKESEQLLFLQWLADPSGSTKRHCKEIISTDVNPTESFENGKYKIEAISGKVPTFHVSLKKGDQEDEKVPE